jgi:hypothetical protein
LTGRPAFDQRGMLEDEANEPASSSRSFPAARVSSAPGRLVDEDQRRIVERRSETLVGNAMKAVRTEIKPDC